MEGLRKVIYGIELRNIVRCKGKDEFRERGVVMGRMRRYVRREMEGV